MQRISYPKEERQKWRKERHCWQKKKRLRERLGDVNEDEEEISRCEEALKEAGTNCRSHRRRVEAQRKEEVLERLWAAWRERRLSETHKIVNELVRSKVGPKKRNYNNLHTALPSRKEWWQVWQLPGGQGGMQRKVVGDFKDNTCLAWEEIMRVHESFATEMPPRDLNHRNQAMEDVWRLQKY